MLLTTTQQLTRFCEAQAGADYVTVDTEFMRERTYYAKLCLVQVAGPNEAAVIDPLAEGMDLAPLYRLLADKNILKVFHAARQDVEIFFNATGQVPAPLFDTQVAAMVCGFGEAASYETLADKLAKVKIDKSSRFTDWARRPLTDRQAEYALADVTHLRVVYEKLAAQLEKSGRSEWMREEMEVLTNPATYMVNPQEIWKRLKLRADKPRLRALLRELAAWRETEAQKQDVPRSRVLKDEALMEITHHAPSTKEDLARMRGIHGGFAESRLAEEILTVVARVKAMTPDQFPPSEPRRIMPKGSAAVLDLLKVLLKQVSDEYGVAAKLIATTDDLEIMAAEDAPEVKAMKGWRRQLFGETAMALKRGELALAVKKNKVIFFRA